MECFCCYRPYRNNQNGKSYKREDTLKLRENNGIRIPEMLTTQVYFVFSRNMNVLPVEAKQYRLFISLLKNSFIRHVWSVIKGINEIFLQSDKKCNYKWKNI